MSQRSRWKGNEMAVVRVSALYTYPIKSCAGLSHEQIMLGSRGLLHDREWMVVDAGGTFITQREIPRMALITPAPDSIGMTVNAPGMPTLRVVFFSSERERHQITVWRYQGEAEDAGDEAAAWFSAFLGVPAHLVRMPEDVKRLTSTDYTDEAGEVSFADGYPLLFISKASLADLNDRLVERGKAPVPMNRFRPNVVISGCGPYGEDNWKQVTIAGIRFDVVKPCARCVITTVDQSVGASPDVREPLATLATYRRGANGGAMFGQNVIHRGTGTISVGDKIEI
jgi:uncharacterized protein YcbX